MADRRRPTDPTAQMEEHAKTVALLVDIIEHLTDEEVIALADDGETTCTECSGDAHEDEGYHWHGELVCCGCFSELVYLSLAVDVNTDREGATA